ncbi:MAG: GDYXXLXY domain-containing protein [Planctomycetes bacterium]|nr:GDYXXLXY domain-containing protein [Planctomycetota bacterium]
MRRLAIALNLVVFLVFANWLVDEQNETIATGRRVLLPIWTSSGMALGVGQYVSLSYDIQPRLREVLGMDARGEGQVVLSVDADRVGTFARLHDIETLAPDEVVIRYRIRWGRAETVRVAAEQWFVEEGQAGEVQKARFAEVALTEDGRALLVGLRRADFSPIGSIR